ANAPKAAHAHQPKSSHYFLLLYGMAGNSPAGWVYKATANAMPWKTRLDFVQSNRPFDLYLLLLPHRIIRRLILIWLSAGAPSMRLRAWNENTPATWSEHKGVVCRCVACRSGAGSWRCVPCLPWEVWRHVTRMHHSVTWPG